MKIRAALLLGTLLASAAWSGETPTFDLKSDAVRNIVRTSAATQFAADLVVEKAQDAKTSKTVRFVPAEKAVKKERPAPHAAPAPWEGHGFLSALVDTVIDLELDNVLGNGGQILKSCTSGVPEAQARATALCEQ